MKIIITFEVNYLNVENLTVSFLTRGVYASEVYAVILGNHGVRGPLSSETNHVITQIPSQF